MNTYHVATKTMSDEMFRTPLEAARAIQSLGIGDRRQGLTLHIADETDLVDFLKGDEVRGWAMGVIEAHDHILAQSSADE